jgi:hypothetical protein
MNKKIDWLEAAVGGALILSGGVAFMPTTIPGAVLVTDAFGITEVFN